MPGRVSCAPGILGSRGGVLCGGGRTPGPIARRHRHMLLLASHGRAEQQRTWNSGQRGGSACGWPHCPWLLSPATSTRPLAGQHRRVVVPAGQGRAGQVHAAPPEGVGLRTLPQTSGASQKVHNSPMSVRCGQCEPNMQPRQLSEQPGRTVTGQKVQGCSKNDLPASVHPWTKLSG